MAAARAWGWAILVLAVMLAAPAAAAAEILTSPDGRHVYLTAAAHGGPGPATWVLRRDGATGELAAVEDHPGTGSDLELSPDGASIYRAQVFWQGMQKGPRIVGHRRDAESGRLTALSVSEPPNHTALSDLVVSPNGRQLYATDSIRGELVIYDRDPATGDLRLAGSVSRSAASLAISPDGAQLFAGVASVELFDRAEDGTLTADGAIECDCYPGSLVFSPSGDVLYSGTYRPRALIRDPSTGGWSAGPALGLSSSSSEAGPSSMAAAGEHTLYVIEGSGGSTKLHQVRRTGESLELEKTYRDLKDGVDGLDGATSVSLSPDGRHLYAGAGAGAVIFRRDPASGALTFLSRFRLPEAPPPETSSVTINDGASFTNEPWVTLTVSGRLRGAQLTVSNDGGFSDSRTLQASPEGRLRWKLASTGPERLPKTVYAHGPIAPPLVVRDDIVLDERVPVVLSARRVPRRSGLGRVRLAARDRISGVRSVQVARDRRHPGRWRRYSRRARYRAVRGRVFVRVRDRAGNRSRWRAVKRMRSR